MELTTAQITVCSLSLTLSHSCWFHTFKLTVVHYLQKKCAGVYLVCDQHISDV